MSRVVLKNIAKIYNAKYVLSNINLIGDPGSMIAIKGKSGSGKSTLLNIIAGLEKPSSGEFWIQETRMNDNSFSFLAKFRSEHIGYISQHSPMIPELTVLENIAVPLWFEKNENNRAVYQDRIEVLSDHFEIKHLLGKKIGLLSGGEIQRVGVIRGLIKKPQIIVADEPTGSLDDETALLVMEYFKVLKAEGATIVIATHSALVAEYCDKKYALTKDGLFLFDSIS